MSNVAWGIDEPIHIFIEFADSLTIAPGHQILGQRIPRKQTRITCTNNFTMSLRGDFSMRGHATRLAQRQRRIIGELMPAHNVGNGAHGKKLTW